MDRLTSSVGFRLTDLVAAISLATDLATGQPLENALRTWRLAMDVSGALGLDPETVGEVHYVALLRFLGCTSDASETARLAGGDNLAFNAALAPALMGGGREIARPLLREVGRDRGPVTRARLLIEALSDPNGASLIGHCEVGARLAARLGLGHGVVTALDHAYERWDGRGPRRVSGEAIPRGVRVVAVARDAVLWHRLIGWEAAVDVLVRRRGRAYDPSVVDAARGLGPPQEAAPEWEDVLAGEPEPIRRIGELGLDRALAAVADFADLRSVWTLGRSTRVADVAARAGRSAGLPPAEVADLRRAALVADVGAVGVATGIWERPGPLGAQASERVRLHPYLTERILGRCAGLQGLAVLAGSHHERLDGTGYHRGARGADLSRAARLLAAADTWTALGEARPHRPALAPPQAREVMRAEVEAGRLYGTAVEAVLDGTGAGGHRMPRPAGLTEREVQVLRLVARGASNREVARQLGITVKTAGHHVDHIYAKVGVTSRPAAALFAVETGLLLD